MRKHTNRQGNSLTSQEGTVKGWSLVWRLHTRKLSSRQRRVASYPSIDAAYQALRTIQQQARWANLFLSAAYLVSPQGRKISLLSGAPPHLPIDHARLTDLMQHPQTRPLAAPAPSPPDLHTARAILHRRILSAFMHAAEVSQTTATVIAYISNALLNQTDEALATLCAKLMGPPTAEPHQLPPHYECLFRRLRSLSTRAQAVSPETARVLAALAHAFAQGRDDVVLQACRVYHETYGATPFDPERLYDNLPLSGRASYGVAPAPEGREDK